MAHNEMSASMRECIEACLECYSVCLETVQHCLSMGGKHASPDHISTLLTCARICETSASAMLLGSELHGESCRACAAICAACADECRQMADGDALMTRCAEVCDRCASSCEKMASAHRA